jgi:hypothetical protein
VAVQFLFGALALVPVVLLVVGAARGRVTVQSCCSVPAERDGRITSALRVDSATSETIASRAR